MTRAISRVMNLTPHAVVFEIGEQRVLLPVSTAVARVQTTRVTAGSVTVGGLAVPVVCEEATGLSGLPAAEAGTVLVVSRTVAHALPERTDLLVPTDLVRNEAGAVVACRALATTSSWGSSPDGFDTA